MSKQNASTLKYRIESAAANLVIGAFGLLPLNAARGLGRVLAKIVITTNQRMLKTTRENLDLCFPDKDADEKLTLAYESVEETIKLALEFPIIGNRSYAWLKSKIKKVEGDYLVKDALAQNKGVVILAPHIGNWEVLGLYLRELGPVTSLYQPPRKRYLEAITKRFREKSGANLVPTNQRGVAKILSTLKRGQISGILPDQVPDEGAGQLAPFYREQALTMTFVHRLLEKTDSVAIYAFAKRVRGGFELIFFAADEAIYAQDSQTSLAALNAGVAKTIEHCPAQYQWEYKRFRRNGKHLYDKHKKRY